MGNLENLKQAEKDFAQQTQTKRGRRVLIAAFAVGFLVVIILLALFRAC